MVPGECEDVSFPFHYTPLTYQRKTSALPTEFIPHRQTPEKRRPLGKPQRRTGSEFALSALQVPRTCTKKRWHRRCSSFFCGPDLCNPKTVLLARAYLPRRKPLIRTFWVRECMQTGRLQNDCLDPGSKAGVKAF